MLKLFLLVAAIPVVLLGGLHLALRVLRFVKKYRGRVVRGLAEEGVSGFIAEALESWVDQPSSSHATYDHASGELLETEHHGHSAGTASHSD